MKIILIGFMGVGKTVIGKKLAKKLNIRWVDIDEEIEKREQKSIENIFEVYGEGYFRILENNLLKELVNQDNIVISTGGGILKKEENYSILKNEENVVFLDANVDTIIKNLSSNKDEINRRPLLKTSINLYKTIENLLYERYEKYISVSNFKIDTNDKNIDEVVSQILVYNR